MYCVLNLPRNTDPEDIVRYADSVILQRVTRVYGRCTAFYTVENGTHPHLNILYQFGQTIEKERLLEILKSVTTLSDIVVTYVNNAENMVDYMTKEDGCYQAHDGSTRQLHDKDIYRTQHTMNVAGNNQRHKRPSQNLEFSFSLYHYHLCVGHSAGCE